MTCDHLASSIMFSFKYLAWSQGIVFLYASCTVADGVTPLSFTPRTPRPPIDLQDIGYNGTWEKFCNRSEISKDSPPYPQHELRVLRIEICHSLELHQFHRRKIDKLIEYKYCILNRKNADTMLEEFVTKFSEDDEVKKAEIFSLGPSEWNPACVMQCQEALRVQCIDRDNPYFRMFYTLIERACSLPWLPVTKIRRHLKEVCEGKRIPGTDWNQIMEGITYRE